MQRYAITIAQMYYGETDFPALLRTTKGFCLPHYALLLQYAGYAKNAVADYLSCLYELQSAKMASSIANLKRFSAQFDYRKSVAPPAPDTLQNVLHLYGIIPKK